jgi:hypothetical protein
VARGENFLPIDQRDIGAGQSGVENQDFHGDREIDETEEEKNLLFVNKKKQKTLFVLVWR